MFIIYWDDDFISMNACGNEKEKKWFGVRASNGNENAKWDKKFHHLHDCVHFYLESMLNFESIFSTSIGSFQHGWEDERSCMHYTDNVVWWFVIIIFNRTRFIFHCVSISSFFVLRWYIFQFETCHLPCKRNQNPS